MGNRKLRKEASEALKAAGFSGKLYRGNKRIAYRGLSARLLRELIRKLKYRPGDLVNDCDGFNHRIKKPLIEWNLWHKNTWIIALDQFEFEDGRRSCGCPYGPDDPWTVKRITKFHSVPDADIEKLKESKWWTERNQKLVDRIRLGIPICDENGIKLPLE